MGKKKTAPKPRARTLSQEEFDRVVAEVLKRYAKALQDLSRR